MRYESVRGHLISDVIFNNHKEFRIGRNLLFLRQNDNINS